VRYRDVYPGIDLVFRGDQGTLEYDFLLKPFADPEKIRVHWKGAIRARFTSEGDLVLETSAGEVRQKKPRIFQEKRRTHDSDRRD